MELLIFLGSMFILLLTGLPVGVVLMLCSLILLWSLDMLDAMLLAQQMIMGADNHILTTIPFFILAGEIMKHGGISERLIALAKFVVGRFRGGMGYAGILACTLFAGLSGVAIADVSALGAVLIPMMATCGYDKARATGLVCSAALTAPIIPPSLPMIVLGVTAGLSIGKLFVMGIVPGLLLALTLMGTWFIVVRKDGYHDVEVLPMRRFLPVFINAFPALMLPVIIIVGIRTGFFTSTEGGAVACVYAFIVAVVLHRELKWRRIPDIFFSAVKSSATVMFIVSTAYTIGWLITIAQVPAQVITLFQDLVHSPTILLITLNILLLALGMVMDLIPIILIFAPVIYPLILASGIDPYYFAILMIMNLCVGLLTPPVGTVLYVGCSVSGLKLNQVVRGILPFLFAELCFILALILFPALITAPADWFG